jgi:hypothetical protein
MISKNGHGTFPRVNSDNGADTFFFSLKGSHA